MNDIITQVNILDKNEDESLYSFLLEQINNESKNVEFWISLAIAIVMPPIVDEKTSIAFLNKALAIDNNNPTALLILTYVYEHELGGIDDMLLHQIKNLHTDSDEINSMLKCVASWSYCESKKYDPEEEERLLKESILLCDKHVRNYKYLARLYFEQERYLEANNLLKKALNNIKKVYSDDDDYDITDINEFINERIKGIYVSKSNLESLQEDIMPNHVVIFYTIITPFLNFYHWIREELLCSENSDDFF